MQRSQSSTVVTYLRDLPDPLDLPDPPASDDDRAGVVGAAGFGSVSHQNCFGSGRFTGQIMLSVSPS